MTKVKRALTGLAAAALGSLLLTVSAAAAPTGSVTGTVTSYCPGLETRIELVNAEGDTAASQTIAATTGEGRTNQAIRLTAVPVGVYDLVIRKGGCLPYTVTGVRVAGDLDLSASGKAGVTSVELPNGDINGDGYIDSLDITAFMFDMGKTSEDSVYEYSDLTGDRYRDAVDVTVLSFNLLRETPVVSLDNRFDPVSVSFAPGAGATGSMESVTAEPGDAIVLPEPTFVGNAAFLGWTDGTDTYGAGESYAVPGEITLTARWAKFDTTRLIYDFNSLSARGSSWWGTVSPTLTPGGHEGSYFALPAGESVICGNLRGEDVSLDLSCLEEAGMLLSVWVRLDAASDVTLRVDLTSQRDAPAAERSASWSVSDLDAGWNQIFLALDDAAVGDSFDPATVQFVHFCMVGDSIPAWGVDELAVGRQNDGSVSLSRLDLTDADAMAGFWGESALALDNVMQVEGSGCVTAENSSCAIICHSMENTSGVVDASEYAEDLTLHLSVYVSDASRLTGNSQFELYAGPLNPANNAAPCYRWSLDSLHSGWNELSLSFDDAAEGRSGSYSPALNAIRSLRLFCYANDAVTIALDDVYLTSSARVARYYANNLTCLDSMKSANCSVYSEAAWTVSGATATFASTGGRLNESGSAKLSVRANTTGVLCKIFSNVDVSENDYVYLWLYVDRAANLTGGQLEFTSSKQPDCYETSWNLTSLGLHDGWNELKLPLDGTGAASNEADFAILNYVRFYFPVNAATEIAVDGIYFGTEEQIAALSNEKETTRRDVWVIENCDTADNWNGTGISFVPTSDPAVEGRGYVTSALSGAGDIVFAKTYRATDHWMYQNGAVVNTWRYDIRDYADSQLVVSLYVSDASAVMGGQVELTSSYGPDTDELGWNLGSDYPLTDGWNTLVLPMADAVTVGSPNLREINFLRVYLNCSAAVTAGLDNIYLGYPVTPNTVTFTASDIKEGPAATTVTTTRSYKDGARVRALDAPAIGYAADTDFLGWLCDGTLYLPGDYFTVSGDMTFTAQYRPKDVNANVYAAYALDDGGTSEANLTANTTGMGRMTLESAVAGTPNATADAAVWINSPTFGRVLDFSATGAYASVSGLSVPFSDAFNCEMWFNAPPRKNADRYLVSSDAFKIVLRPSTGLIVTCQGKNVTVTQSLTDGLWHHLSVTVNGGTVTVAIDGVTAAQQSLSLSSSTVIRSLLIGASGTAYTGNDNFDGHIARFALTRGTQNYYGYGSVTIAADEYDPDLSLGIKKGVVIDRRQYWNYNPYTYEGATVSPVDIANIKSLGFDHVKLLLTPNWLIDDNGELIYENMSYIAPLLDQIVEQDFLAILCLHPEEGYKGTYLNARNIGLHSNFLQDITSYIAERWGTDHIALQLMTEPNAQDGSLPWDFYSDRMWGAARNACGEMMLITSSDDCGNAERLRIMSPVFDYNLVYSFTTYEPYTIGFNNYAQNSFWPYAGDVMYPVPDDMPASAISARVEQDIALVPDGLKAEARSVLTRFYNGQLDSWRGNPYPHRYNRDWHMARCKALDDWSKANGGNIHMMAVEFGCSDTQYNQAIMHAAAGSGITDAKRLVLIDDLSDSFDAYNIGWSYWSYNEYFHLLDTTAHVGLNGQCLSPEQFSRYVDRDLIAVLLDN